MTESKSPPLQPVPATETIEVFVEIPQGGDVRHRYKSLQECLVEPFPGTDIVPALAVVAYGCIPGTLNPADGGALDVHILGAEGIPAGSTVQAKVVGIRLRNNGDHKVMVAVAGHLLSRLDEVTQLPEPILEALARWDEAQSRPGERWGTAEEGRAWVSKLRI